MDSRSACLSVGRSYGRSTHWLGCRLPVPVAVIVPVAAADVLLLAAGDVTAELDSTVGER